LGLPDGAQGGWPGGQAGEGIGPAVAPTLLNGEPVPVIAMVTVIFSLK
jgi:hypothetical protein